MAVKVSTLLRHLKKIKAAEKSNIVLLMPNDSKYMFPNGKGFFKACCDVFNGKRGTPDIQAVMTATASKNGGQLIELIRMLDTDKDDDNVCG